MLEKASNYLHALVMIIDPGNDTLPFTASIDVSNLITVEDAMENCHLGPNGALIYCMEFIEKNLDWLFTQIAKFSDHYFIFDLPGQVNSIYTYVSSSCVLIIHVNHADGIIHSQPCRKKYP